MVYMTVIYHGNLRQGDHKFAASLGYTVRPCIQMTNEQKRKISLAKVSVLG
jgi:hypothetical protein